MNTKRRSMITFCAVTAIALGMCILSIFGIGSDHLFGVQRIRQGLDLKGGVSIVYEASKENPTSEEISAARSLLRGRLDRQGYTEADLVVTGNNRFQVDIPGVEDAEQVINAIGRTALITFSDPLQNVLFDGSNIKTARRDVYNDGSKLNYVVSLEFDEYGTEVFARATAEFTGDVIYIMLDEEVLSSPVVNTVISDGKCYIEGNFTAESAEELAALIRAGSLPFNLDVINMKNVGAKLGANSLETSIMAGIIGMIAVVIFMLVFYKIAGLAANIALVMYSGLMLLILSTFELTLTLPGIAGIVLSIGMAVDANVIIFERFKEELIQNERSMRSAIDIAFKKAFSAIIDANITSVMAAVVLFWLGTGPIKGFAVTFFIGILLSMFTAIVITRVLLKSLCHTGLTKPSLYGAKEYDANKVIKVVENRKLHFMVPSAVVALALIFMIVNAAMSNGLFNYDVDFSGGTSIHVDFAQDDVSNDDVREIITNVTGQQSSHIQQIVGTTEAIIKIKSIDSETRVLLVEALKEKYPNIDSESAVISDVSAAVSGEMQRMAVIATLVASGAMFIYISIRFRDIKMGGSTIINQLVNAVLVVSFYAILRIPLNTSFIIVILTVLGYTVNSTIVTFDRIRENREIIKKISDFGGLINLSITQTIRRSLYTAITTILTVLSLYIFGVASVREFSLPIMLGIIFGTYSSISLAGSILFFLMNRKKA